MFSVRVVVYVLTFKTKPRNSTFAWKRSLLTTFAGLLHFTLCMFVWPSLNKPEGSLSCIEIFSYHLKDNKLWLNQNVVTECHNTISTKRSSLSRGPTLEKRQLQINYKISSSLPINKYKKKLIKNKIWRFWGILYL